MRMRSISRRRAAALMCLLAPAGALRASSFTVTRFDDPLPDGCAPTDCSLREAVMFWWMNTPIRGRPATPNGRLHNRLPVLRAERRLSRHDLAEALGIN